MEDVRMLVQEEGRAARNLVAFHVDLASPMSGKSVSRKPPSSPRLLSETRMTKRSAIVAKAGARVRSASTGRDKKSELQARYWAFLFGNLQRSVDEIYQTCESDESVSECKEVILVLENFTRDFHNLIEWFKLKWEYENTPPPQRPNSLAWEVRKSSPGKVLNAARMEGASRNEKQSPVKKQLNFFSNVKLSSAEEPRRVVTPEGEQLLSNQYGLSFGDINLKDHFSAHSNADEKLSENCQGDEKCVERTVNNVVESNSTISLVENKCDVPFSDRSSQTDLVSLQSCKTVPKSVAPTMTVTKKPPSAVKTSSNAVSKSGTVLTPLTVKTVMTPPTRKTVPLSPTSSAPSRSVIPGRNVAAATFVPSKKPVLSQLKTNSLSRSTSNLNKSENIPNPSITGDIVEVNESVDTNKLAEQKCPKVKELLISDIDKTKDLNKENVDSCNFVLNDSVLKEKKITTEVPKSGVNLSNVPIVINELKMKTPDILGKSEISSKIYKTNNVIKLDNKSIEQKISGVDKTTNEGNKTEIKNSLEVSKKEKCDKSMMTDPLVTNSSAPVPKQAPVKVTTLVRNKTVPSLIRKSSESLSAPDTMVEPGKAARISTISSTKSTLVTVKKQPSIPETTNEKPAYSAVSKVYRSNTAIELRPSRMAHNRNVSSASARLAGQEKLNSSSHREKKSSIINQSLIKNSSSIFKSEQSLRKRNSVDEDGWETVKGRSRWRLSQSSGNIKARTATPGSRYHLPSPATSLPALTLATDVTEPYPDHRPAKVHKDKQNQEIAKATRPESVVTKRKNREETVEKKLKSVTSDRKKMSSVRNRNSNLRKSDAVEKSDYNENKLEKLMDILSSEDERINEEEMRKSMELYEEEKMLTKEIQDLEKAEIEIDTETDDAETDGEATNGTEEDEDTNSRISALKASYEDVCHQLSWADQMDTLEKLEELMAMDTSTKGVPMSERLITLEQLEELVARHPGRALELHQKLSSPSRRRPLPDTIQRHHARQASAQRKRQQLLHDKSAKMRELLNKVEEVKLAQAQLVEVRKQRLADKLKRAEENRASHLRSIQRKAHDEEEKLREIAFINELEAQNKRHDFMALCQEQQDRLQGILDERQRRQEEKAAKEAAVEERRRILEAERQEKLEKMQERRRKREERIDREQQEKEKERLELAREKARDREERLQALQAAQLATVEELQKKIQQKQFDSARRHEENIEHIRQRALESGALRGGADDEAPRLTPYDTQKLCRVCNVLIESEVYLLSHLRGKAHQEAVRERDDSDEVIVDAPQDKMNAKMAQDRERQKALRKRCKKIRSRMALRGDEYTAKLGSVGIKRLESPNKGRLLKCLRDVDKLQASQGIGQWPNNAVTLLERNLAEINRILEKQNALDQKVFRDLNGFTTLSNVLNLALDIPKNMSPYLPPKCFMTTCTVYSLACAGSPDNSRFVIFTNKIALVLDLLLNRLNALITDDYKKSKKSSNNLPLDPVAGALMKLFALVMSFSQEDVTPEVPDLAPRLQDIISYTVSVGVVDKLAVYCSSVRDPIDNNPQAAQFLLNAIQLLTTLAQTKCGLVKGDPTQLVATLRVTELVGGVSMLYGMLLHHTGQSPPTLPTLPPHTVTVTRATLQLLRAVAQLDIHLFQSVLGAEGMSLQLRHIASHLLWYCSQAEERELLHQVIQVVGFFAVMNHDNQMMLQSGHMPTVLQQLCNLPFEYFSDPALSYQLFPTLLACCHGNADNRAILEQELSYQLLEDFRKSDEGRKSPLVQLLK